MSHDVVITIRIGADYYQELQARLEKYGITRQQLAQAAGVTKSAITHQMTRGHTPRVSTVRRLEEAIARIRAERAAARRRPPHPPTGTAP